MPSSRAPTRRPSSAPIPPTHPEADRSRVGGSGPEGAAGGAAAARAGRGRGGPRTPPAAGLRSVVAVGVAAVMVLSGCSDGGTGPDGGPDGGSGSPLVAPTPPPVASLVADLTPIVPTPATSAGPAAAAADGSHFTAATIRGSSVRQATAGRAADARRAFEGAAGVTPVFADGAHRWRYTHTRNGVAYAAELAGRRTGDGVAWTLDLAGPGASAVRWMEGEAREDGDEGQWRVFDPSWSTSVPRLTVDWAHPAEDRWAIRFQDAGEADEPVGPWMNWEATGTFRRVTARANLHMEWDVVGIAGFIESPTINGGLRICWGADREDVPCG